MSYIDELRSSKCFGNKKTEVKKIYTIPKKNKKTIDSDKELKKLAKIFLARPENKYCNIQIDENCTKLATIVNHTKRRGANKLNVETFEASCVYCNNAIENSDQWAREHGHLKSKFSPTILNPSNQ